MMTRALKDEMSRKFIFETKFMTAFRTNNESKAMKPLYIISKNATINGTRMGAGLTLELVPVSLNLEISSLLES